MGPIEALERSRVVEIRHRLMAPMVVKEASAPKPAVRRYAPNLRSVAAVKRPVAKEARPAPAIVPEPAPARPEALVFPPGETRREAIRRIIAACAEEYGVEPFEVRGQRRNLPIVRARQKAMFRMQCELDMSTVAIGRSFDKDHTTVMHSIEAHQKRFPEAAEIGKRHAEKVMAELQYDRQRAMAAYAAGEITFSEAADLARVGRPKARRLFAEHGIVGPTVSRSENPLI